MNYDEILTHIQEIESWLVTVGKDPSRSRLAKYKADLQILVDSEKRNHLLDHFTPAGLNELFFTFIEVSEIHAAFSTLASKYGPNIKERLVTIVTGPSSSAAERAANAGNHPRNLQFELFLTAQLALAGFPIEATTQDDVRTSFKGREIIFECKRPQAFSGIHAAIKDGVGQLRKCRSRGEPKPLAILAISLTKAMTEGRALLRAPDSRTAMELLHSLIEEQMGPHISYFYKQAVGEVAGILVHSCMTTLPSGHPSIAAVGAQVFFDNPQLLENDQKFIRDWYSEYERLERLPPEEGNKPV